MFSLDSKLVEFRANEESPQAKHILIVDNGRDCYGAPSLEEAEMSFKALGFLTSISAPEPGRGALNEAARAYREAPVDFVVFHGDFEEGELRKIADDFCRSRALADRKGDNWAFMPRLPREAQPDAALEIAVLIEKASQSGE